MSAKELERLIYDNLDSSNDYQDIEIFFDSQDWIYDYDRYASRYQAIDPREDQLPEIAGRHQIYVYVDEQKNFERVEIIKMHNAP